jgi:hypothetical protein
MSTSRSFVSGSVLPCIVVGPCASTGATRIATLRPIGFVALASLGAWLPACYVGRAAAAFCIPAYFQWLGCSLHCQSKTECPSLLHAG